MPFLQAIFCLKGFDDRNRFFITSTSAILGFILLSALFSQYFTFTLALLILLTIVLVLSTIRRLHDAKLNKNWQLVPGGLFLITGLICLFMDNSNTYYLLILPALSIALLLTYPSHSNMTKKRYILGYSGPVDLSCYQQDLAPNTAHNRRIEPTLAGNENTEALYINDSNNRYTEPDYYQEDSTQSDIGELIRLTFLSNRKLQIGVMVSVSVVVGVALLTSLYNAFIKQDITGITTESVTQVVPSKNNIFDLLATKKDLVNMPDNFNLYLSEFNGIIIHWQADQVDSGEYWSQVTTIGDQSCQEIKFNKGDSLRPLSVLVENGINYFAMFSPLDSKELVQALAFRGDFSLCGYRFSLKGTQAVLAKNINYAPLLD